MVKSLKCQPCKKCRSRDLLEMLQELHFCDAPVGKPCFICEDSWATDESSVNDAITTPKVPTTHTVSKEHSDLPRQMGFSIPERQFTIWRKMPSSCILSFSELRIIMTPISYVWACKRWWKYIAYVICEFKMGSFHRLTETGAQVVKSTFYDSV